MLTKKKTIGRARRFGAAALAATVAAGLFAGCSSDSGDSDGPVTIEFWGWVPGIEDLVDQWNENNSDIQVEFNRMTGDDQQKVEGAVEAGTAPDLIQLTTHSIPNYVISGWAQDITEYASGMEDEYVPSAWNAVSVEGRVYGIPQDIGPGGMMYRADLFEEHGIDVPTTWDEYLDAARALHEADPDLHIANLSPSETGQWTQQMQQAHGSWYQIGDDTWEVTVDSEESQVVAERWQTLLDEDLVTTEQMWTPEYWTLVNEGSIATITYAAWFPVLLAENAAETSGAWRVAPMPTYPGESYSSDTGGAALVVLEGSEHPAEAVEFANWLNSSPDTQEHLITVGGLFPASNAGLESEALMQPMEFFGDQVVNEVFVESARNAAEGWIDGPNYGFVSTAIADEFARAVNGEITFSEALSNAADATRDDLASRGLTVE